MCSFSEREREKIMQKLGSICSTGHQISLYCHFWKEINVCVSKKSFKVDIAHFTLSILFVHLAVYTKYFIQSVRTFGIILLLSRKPKIIIFY